MIGNVIAVVVALIIVLITHTLFVQRPLSVMEGLIRTVDKYLKFNGAGVDKIWDLTIQNKMILDFQQLDAKVARTKRRERNRRQIIWRSTQRH